MSPVESCREPVATLSQAEALVCIQALRQAKRYWIEEGLRMQEVIDDCILAKEDAGRAQATLALQLNQAELASKVERSLFEKWATRAGLSDEGRKHYNGREE
jgi:hypothetical protein